LMGCPHPQKFSRGINRDKSKINTGFNRICQDKSVTKHS
jgi:hypothetical protein